MKKLALLLALFGAHAALAQTAARRLSESQALTRTTPSIAVDAPFLNISTTMVSLDRAIGYRIMLCAPSGQTLTGGTLLAWTFDDNFGILTRNPDKDLTVGTPGTQCRSFNDEVPAGSRSSVWLLYAASSVTVSSGSAVTVYYTVIYSSGGRQ